MRRDNPAFTFLTFLACTSNSPHRPLDTFSRQAGKRGSLVLINTTVDFEKYRDSS